VSALYFGAASHIAGTDRIGVRTAKGRTGRPVKAAELLPHMAVEGFDTDDDWKVRDHGDSRRGD
jgi:hypothetical protein